MIAISREEKLNVNRMYETSIDLAREADPMKYTTLFLGRLADIFERMMMQNLKTREIAIREIIPQFDSMKDDYRRSINRSLFSKDSGIKREMKAAELAILDTIKILELVNENIKKNEIQVEKTKELFIRNLPEIAISMLESTKSGGLLKSGRDVRRISGSEKSREELEKMMLGVLSE
jgi:hypothetical protein